MMDPIVFLGTIAGPILSVAAVLFLLDFFLLYIVKPGQSRMQALTFVSALMACLFVLASYLILTAAFLTDAFSFREVYTYSSSSLSVLYKLGGPWIGSSGSVLFITMLLALGYGFYRARRYEQENPVEMVTYQILDLFLVFFILVTLWQSPFRQLAVIPPEGMGLNPLLQTPWVVTHPPVIFLGYVAVFFAFILMLAGMIVPALGKEDRRSSLRVPLLVAWLLLTIGIALGGLWSYRVLGWGGYWAWDPVETASLLPWLALTVYFHVTPFGRGVRDLTVAVSFFMVVFATAMTRGGFSESVHAFGESPVSYLLLGFAVTFLLISFSIGWRKRQESRILMDASSVSSVSRYVAAGSLIGLLGVCFIGSVAPVVGSVVSGVSLSLKPEFFTLYTYPFTLIFVAALMGGYGTLHARRFAILLTGLGGIGLVMVVTSVPTPYPLANFGLPYLVAAGGVVGHRWLTTIRERQSSRVWGRTLVHLAVVILLIGVFISSAGQIESRPLLTTPASDVDALGSTLRLSRFTLSEGNGSVFLPSHSLVAPEYSGLRAEVEVWDGSGMQTGSLWMFEYLNYGIVSEPLVLSSPTRDLYISMHQTNSSYTSLVDALRGELIPPRDVTVVLKSVPLIGLVWVGTLLMIIGVGIIVWGELRRFSIPSSPP